MQKAACCYTCETHETCEKSGTGEKDNGSRSEVLSFLNFEPGTSNFVPRTAYLSRSQFMEV
jgi:hypothetical protein